MPNIITCGGFCSSSQTIYKSRRQKCTQIKMVVKGNNRHFYGHGVYH
ncbi:hypothetical protein O9993_10675 [Vibrio lentus]|nr:hypothetical protein [Vibrio lentus]